MAEEEIDNAYVINLLKQQSTREAAAHLATFASCPNKNIETLHGKIKKLKKRHFLLKRTAGRPARKAEYENFLKAPFAFPIGNPENPPPRLVNQIDR